MNFYGPAVKTEELAVVVSKPSDKYFAGCTASTEYTQTTWGCLQGLNGNMRDDENSQWASKSQGQGAWIQVDFRQTMMVTGFQIVGRNADSERNKQVTLTYDDGTSRAF